MLFGIVVFLLKTSFQDFLYIYYFRFFDTFLFQRVYCKKWEVEKQHELKVLFENIEKRDNSLEKINQLIEDYFEMKYCSKCNDNHYSLIEINNQGTGIHMQCNTCNKKVWFKSGVNFEKGDLVRRHWDNFIYYSDSISSEPESFSITVDQDFSMDSNIEQKQLKRESIPQSIKDKVWNRDGGKCVQCGSNENIEFDHIIPFSKGGSSTYRNLQILCEKCNRSKSDKIG